MLQTEQTPRRNPASLTIREMAFAAVMTALLCVLSPLSIPIGPVSLTLQTLVVALTGYALGVKLGILSTAAYLLLGACGLPVFSGFKGGVSVLVGPTGGYLIGFLFMAGLCGLGKKWKVWQAPLAGLAGLCVVYIIGTIQLKLVLEKTFEQAIMIGVAPFVLKDAASVICAALLARGITRRIPALA